MAKRLRSLRSSEGFKRFVLDQLAGLGDVTGRSMFGGTGLYCDDVFFGIIARDALYLKVDDTTRRDYERAGSAPFKPYEDRSGTMQYYAAPLDVLESAPELIRWARAAVAVAEKPQRPARARMKGSGSRREASPRGR